MTDNNGSIPIGLQLFAVRGECAKDLPATLVATAEMGYVGVEPWGYEGKDLTWQGLAGTEIRRILDDKGLICCGFHLSTVALQGDNMARTIEFNHQLGNKFLIIAGDSKRMSAVDSIMELAEILNEAVGQLKPHGMLPGYHAHPFDFAEVDGRAAWDILFSNTEADVIMQMDNGNCMAGGGDPVAILRKFPGRTRSMHVKEPGGPDAAIGDGDQVDWAELFSLCETSHPIEWYVVEQGGVDGLGFDVCARSLHALKKMASGN